MSSKSKDENYRKLAVEDTYKLLRSYSEKVSFLKNYPYSTPGGNSRLELPDDMKDDLTKVLSETDYTKFKMSIRAGNDRYEKELPANINSDVADNLLELIETRQKSHILTKY